MRIINIYTETISDGPGVRYSIYLAGCNHKCEGCHNPQSWDPNEGILVNQYLIDTIKDEINSNPILDGITISGGDPFFNPEELLYLLRELKEGTDKNIWCYTGYSIEYLVRYDMFRKPLEYIDTLVDGPFIKSLRDPNLPFRGSRNQRIINNPNKYINESNELL